MTSEQLAEFANANLYFSGISFGISLILLTVLYLLRWKSDSISVILWILNYLAAAFLTWWITNNYFAPAIAIAINFFLLALFSKRIPVISVFGVLFLISMITPPIYGLVWMFQLVVPIGNYFEAGYWQFSGLWLLALIYTLITAANTFINASTILARHSPLYFWFPRRDAAWKYAQQSRQFLPMVSLHLPCYSEPPELVIDSLNALAKMDYPHYEVIVIDNNTRDPALWKPIEEHCAKLGPRFRFYHYDVLNGAKAGALNEALVLSNPQASIIGVIDADYIANQDFLQKLVALFNDPRTGFVQTCHDYRAWEGSTYQTGCYYEYEVHFKLNLPAQSEFDAAYTVGTMCLLRREAVEKAGGWAEWCLTEDSEIAVRLHALGYKGYYFMDTFGKGIIPENFSEYKKQRFRWCAGPVQQFQKHWRLYLPWAKELTGSQKWGEICHSLTVLFSELGIFLMILPVSLACIWYTVVEGQRFYVPYSILIFVPLAAFRSVIYSRIRVGLTGGGWKEAVYSLIAARSLYYTRYKAFYMAFFKMKLYWHRTDKFKVVSNFARIIASTRDETILGAAFLVAALVLIPYASFWKPDLLAMMILLLLNQSGSYFCSLLMAYLAEKDLEKRENRVKIGSQNAALAVTAEQD